ncbi:MAG: SDR family oxidoreductase [Chlorobi bacterium]|nr:SDR family oxidoreductase [Chlorobiota bacterium]
MNVIITGASRGIGLETARAFLGIPHLRLGIIARNKAKLTEFAAMHVKNDRELIPLPFDLEKNIASVGKITGRIREHFSQVDILINNAGMMLHKPFEELDYRDYTKVFNLNFFSPALLIRALLPFLEKSETRHVVNIGSMGGFQGSIRFPGLTLYSASKAALSNLTESLATEYREKGIRFNCLALGAVQTEMLTETFPGYRTPVSAEDMGRYIRDFSMTAYRFMNGKVIPLSLSAP